MEERLSVAAFEGDTDTLKQLLLEDSKILDKTVLKCYSGTRNTTTTTPLHVVASLGHVDFVKIILEACSDMCLSRDRDGRNPLHLAAIKGKGEVLEVLIRDGRYLAVWEKIDGGGTVLHLCVKYNRFEMLKIIVRAVEDSELLNVKNDEGMTVLHLAVLDLQIETIRYLVEKNIDINAKNANGKTAVDVILTRRKGRGGESGHTVEEIQRILQDSGALRSQDLSVSNNNNGHTVHINASNWLNKKRDTIMIVATLIATFAFQAGLNPAGGVWQDDSMSSTKTSSKGSGSVFLPLHRAGEAIMAYYHPKYYKNFVRANTVAFVSSLSTILLLISGLPFRRRFFMWCLMVIMWLTITSVAMTYGISIMMVTPKHYRKTLSHVIETAVTVWCFVMSLLLLGNTIRLVKRWIKSGGIKRFRARSGGLLVSRDHDQSSQDQELQFQKNGISVQID